MIAGILVGALGVGGILAGKGINAASKNRENEHELAMKIENDKDYQERMRITGENERGILKIEKEYENKI